MCLCYVFGCILFAIVWNHFVHLSHLFLLFPLPHLLLVFVSHISHYYQIKWINYQILDSISWTLEFQFPSPLSQFLQSLHILSFDFFILDCIPGNYLSLVLFWSLLPLLICLLNELVCRVRISLLWYHMSNNNNNNDSLDDVSGEDVSMASLMQTAVKKIKNEHFSFFLLLMFTLLPPVVRRQFVALYCFDLQGEQYLKIDSSIDCNSAEYELFRIYDILAIMVYMMIPLLWATLLYRKRFSINPAHTER
jgi:hypothetical protein